MKMFVAVLVLIMGPEQAPLMIASPDGYTTQTACMVQLSRMGKNAEKIPKQFDVRMTVGGCVEVNAPPQKNL